jgi:hypothetical protein
MLPLILLAAAAAATVLVLTHKSAAKALSAPAAPQAGPLNEQGLPVAGRALNAAECDSMAAGLTQLIGDAKLNLPNGQPIFLTGKISSLANPPRVIVDLTWLPLELALQVAKVLPTTDNGYTFISKLPEKKVAVGGYVYPIR